MAVGPSIDLSGWLDEQLELASPDLLRGMVKTFAEAQRQRRAEAALISVVGDLLPAGSLDLADGPAGAHPGDHRLVQEPGLGDGQEPG